MKDLEGYPNIMKSVDFIGVIEECVLADIAFSCHKFTWSNKRGIINRIWKILYRDMVNDSWLENMPQNTITYFTSTGSDHRPLLMEMTSNETNPIK